MFNSLLFQNYKQFLDYWNTYKKTMCNVRNTKNCLLDLLKNYAWIGDLHQETQNDEKYYQIENLLPVIERYFGRNPEPLLFDNELHEMKLQLIAEMTNNSTHYQKICSGFSLKTSLVSKNKNLYIVTVNEEDERIQTIYHLISQKCNVDNFVNMFEARKILQINNKSSKDFQKLTLIIPKFKILKLPLVTFEKEYNLKQSLFTHEFDVCNSCLSYLVLEINDAHTSLLRNSFYPSYIKNSLYSNLFYVFCHICATRAKTYAGHYGVDSTYLPSSRIAANDTVKILSNSCNIVSDEEFNSMLTSYLQKRNASITKGINDPTLVESHFSNDGTLLLSSTLFDTVSIKLMKSPFFASKQKFIGKKITDIFWNNLLAAENKFRINFYNHTIPTRNIHHNSIFEEQKKIFNFFPYNVNSFLFRRQDFMSGSLFIGSVYNNNTIHRISDVQVNEWKLIDNKLHQITTISSSYDHLIVCDDGNTFVHLHLADNIQNELHMHDMMNILNKKITFTDQNSENSSKYEAHQKYFEIRSIDSEFASIQSDTNSLPEQISIKISKTAKSSLHTILTDISKSTSTTPDAVKQIFLAWFTNGMDTTDVFDPFINMIRFITQDGTISYGISFTKNTDNFSIDVSGFLQKWDNSLNTLSRIDMILLSQAFKGVLIGIYTPTTDKSLFEKKVTHGYHFSDVPSAVDLADTCAFSYVKLEDGLYKILSM